MNSEGDGASFSRDYGHEDNQQVQEDDQNEGDKITEKMEEGEDPE